MSENIHLGNSRRTQLLYPTDLWPNGVEITIDDGQFEVYLGSAMFTSNEEMTTSSGWSFVIVPIKNANFFIIRYTRLEYNYFLYENKKKWNNLNQFPTTSLGNNLYRVWCIPKNAKYIGVSCRTGTNPASIFKGITFYYLPTHSDDLTERCSVLDISDFNTSTTNNKTQKIYCEGMSKLIWSCAPRGAVIFYNGDGQRLLSRNYGEEAGTYIVPDGAVYAEVQSYTPLGTLDDTSFLTTYYLE